MENGSRVLIHQSHPVVKVVVVQPVGAVVGDADPQWIHPCAWGGTSHKPCLHVVVVVASNVGRWLPRSRLLVRRHGSGVPMDLVPLARLPQL